jgi:hypothetical protein
MDDRVSMEIVATLPVGNGTALTHLNESPAKRQLIGERGHRTTVSGGSLKLVCTVMAGFLPQTITPA